MKIETKFSNGDTVYGIQRTFRTDKWQVIGPMTIGQVRVEITDSPGREGEEESSDYMPQKGTSEMYMCVETGIGSGATYSVDRLFSDRPTAEAAAKVRNDHGGRWVI